MNTRRRLCLRVLAPAMRILLVVALCLPMNCASTGCARSRSSPAMDEPAGAISFPMDAKTDAANRLTYLTVWSFQIGRPEDMRAYAQYARELGFDGVGFIVTWDHIQRNKDVFQWDWLDQVLDIVVEQDLKLVLGLMFWTSGLYWEDELCLQQTSTGTIYRFDSQRGANICYNDPENLKLVEAAVSAFAEHTFSRYGARIMRYSAHFSHYGEVEYTPVDVWLDYSPSELSAFRAYLRARPGGIEAFNRDYDLVLSDWDQLDTLDMAALVARQPYDWQHFRQATLINLNRLVAGAVHAVAPDVPVAMQVGSVWDVAAATKRGVFDAYLISRDVDILHIDDAPGWPHDFTLDMAESLAPGRLLAQELDGAQHADALPDLYLRQARMTGASGASMMNTANWSVAALKQWGQPLLSQYHTLFKETPVRPLAPRDRAILFNTADFITRQPASAQDTRLMNAYLRLSVNGQYRVRFATDSMLLADPALLDELVAGLYLGSGAAMRFDPQVAELLASAGCPLYVDGPALPALLDPYGHPLETRLAERLAARLSVAD